EFAMNPNSMSFDRVDADIAGWMQHTGMRALRVSLGIVYLWFGVLKFFPGLSPTQSLATRTIDLLSFGLIPWTISLPILAAWESTIGLCFVTGKYMRAAIFLLLLQMLGTMTPLVLFPREAFARFPYAPSREGQYTLKNLVLISACIVVGGSVRDPRGG